MIVPKLTFVRRGGTTSDQLDGPASESGDLVFYLLQ
jgi:hypothetical protein